MRTQSNTQLSVEISLDMRPAQNQNAIGCENLMKYKE